MSKYQSLIDALAYAKQIGGIGLTASVADLDALLADLEMAEKVMTSPSAGIDRPPAYTYTSTQSTMCASCGEHKHTPLRIDAMGGYVCLTCIDQKLGSLLGEFGYTTPPAPQPAPVDELPDLNPEDVVVDVVLKQLGGFAPVTTHGVRVTHKPSCVSVVVDSERSQHRNRQLALEALRAIIRPQDHPVPAPVDEREAEIAELRAEVLSWRKQCDRLTHQVICCGVAASHPDATLTTRGAYAGKWNSGQAEEVRKLRAERDALASLQSPSPKTKGQP